MTETTSCPLCRPRSMLRDGERWRVVLNENQNLVGKCLVVSRRHVERVAELTPDEWRDLYGELRRVTGALAAVLWPDHFNYAFLQNQDRHVHLHVIPRYASARELAGEVFDDPDYPGHYRVPGPRRRLSEAATAVLAERLQAALEAHAP